MDFDNFLVDNTGKLCYNKIAQIKKKQGGLKLKKRILTMLLSALLVANISACNYAPNKNVRKEVSTSENSSTGDLHTNKSLENNNINEEDNPTQPLYTTQSLIDTLQLSSSFSSVLKNETKVLNTMDNSSTYLNDFIIGSMSHAYVSAIDLDENGTNEICVLEYGDTIILLHEYENVVYAYQYRHNALYNLLIDGTFSWNEQSGNIYGTDKLLFDGAQKNSVSLDRVEHNKKFYINEIEVSQKEYQLYIQNKKLAEKADRYLWETSWKTSDYQENGK